MSDKSKTAYAWTGYREPYVQNIVSGAMKVLSTLSFLTFDLELLVWTKGLQKHLEKRIREAKQDAIDEQKKRF